MDVSQYLKKLEEACERYEKSAPTVAEHCNDLFARMNEAPDKVTLGECLSVAYIWRDEWMQPNYAANTIYKLRHRLGMDTTGHAGF